MACFTVQSPNGQVQLRITLQDGSLFWDAVREGVAVAAVSPLGIRLEGCDLTGGFALISEQRGQIDDTYTIPAFKKAVCRDHANTLSLLFANAEGRLTVEARAYDDGAALRLLVGGEGGCTVLGETTGFAVPDTAGQVYGMKYTFSYEDHYHPIPRCDLWQNNLVFPVLTDCGRGVWALYAEAAVFGDYGSSTLCSTEADPVTLLVRQAPDQLGGTKTCLPLCTPWRVVLCGDLNAIATSNTLENLNPPSIVEDPSFIRPGTSAWSWMTENDSTKDPQRCREYVDYAAAMGFDYYLADGGWPGTVDIPELVKYAEQKGVKIWIWEHSAAIRSPEIAEEKLSLWASWGVVGVKIDFFESDGAHRVKQYDYLAEIAAKHRLMVNFHGCMKPAGESRTWPHVMTREGVMGGEYLQNFSTFLPGGPDAAHNCTLPFTRNAMGPMDYTPVCYNTYLTGTTDAHQTALTVIFTSYILHIGEGAEVVLAHPARPFLSRVPAAWDETRVLEAYPASFVTMARRKGDVWYVGGICARRPRNSRVCFDFLEEGREYRVSLYADDLSDERPFDVAEYLEKIEL
jgi:alpha-glucosidase